MNVLRRAIHRVVGCHFFVLGVHTAEEIGCKKGIITLACRYCGRRKSYVGDCTVWYCIQGRCRPSTWTEARLADIYRLQKLMNDDKKLMEIAAAASENDE